AINYIHLRLLGVYHFLRIPFFIFYLQFFLHAYPARLFDPRQIKHNIGLICRKQERDWLDSTLSGRLMLVTSRWHKLRFWLKNLLVFGAVNSRTKRVVYLSMMALTLELKNPFGAEIFYHFFQRKLHLIEEVRKRLKFLNGRYWDQDKVQENVDIFYTNSLLQQHIIKNMIKVVNRAKEPLIIKEAKAGLRSGLYPVLVTKGGSGSYWMRNPNREVLGIFKPFDEDMGAPNNPVGPSRQGPFGFRRVRAGTRVGEGAHNEVGAYLIDSYFGFGIVPRTYYASFTHKNFFLASQNRHLTLGKDKKKYGSFQEFIQGFISFSDLDVSEIPKIPLIEFQLLVVLDMIIGNSDRHAGNLLIGNDKIAAIDNGFCFPDIPENMTVWLWRYVQQGREPLCAGLVQLIENFPFEEISWKLRKRCSLPIGSIDRMYERITLFREALRFGLVPAEISFLFERKNLEMLKDFKETLPEKCKIIIQDFLPHKEKKLQGSLIEQWLGRGDPK
ncbi:MAG: hypothetical protein ACKVOH_03575, partial [Chlamydiales bacterium]